jgi:hypothetical protein
LKTPKQIPAGAAGLAMRNVIDAMEGRKAAITGPSNVLDGTLANVGHCEVRNERERAARTPFWVLPFYVLMTMTQSGLVARRSSSKPKA